MLLPWHPPPPPMGWHARGYFLSNGCRTSITGTCQDLILCRCWQSRVSRGPQIKTCCQLGTKSCGRGGGLRERRGLPTRISSFNPMQRGVAHTCEFHPAFLLLSSLHIPHPPVGEGRVIFRRGPSQLEVCKTGPTNADATVRFALGGVTPPTRPATAWQLINTVPVWRPPKQAKSGLWSIICPCDVQVCLWGAHLVAYAHGMPFLRELRTNFT